MRCDLELQDALFTATLNLFKLHFSGLLVGPLSGHFKDRSFGQWRKFGQS